MFLLFCGALTTASHAATEIITPDSSGPVGWQARVIVAVSPDREVHCGGTVRDASHIITAAHCLFTETGANALPDDVTVQAGVSNIVTPEATMQERTVSV